MDFSLNFEMRQQQVGTRVECVQQLRRFAVGEVIKAALEGLAIKGEDALPGLGATGLQAGSMPAEHMFDRSWIKALENVRGWRYELAHVSSADQKPRSGGRGGHRMNVTIPRNEFAPGHHGQD